MSKNIWVINQFAGNLESGWGERHYFLSKRWLKDGYNVNIISSPHNHMFTMKHKTDGQFTMRNYDGTNFCWVKCPNYNPKSVMRFIIMFIFTIKVLFVPKKKLGKPDIIIVSSMPIFPIISGYLLKKMYGAETLIFEVRDLWPLSLIYLKDISAWHPLALFIGWFEKFGYRRSDKIVSVLPNSAPYIDNISKDKNKLLLVPNGVAGELQMKKKSLEDTFFDALKDTDFVVGYTGTMGLINALNPLLDAFKDIDKNIKIVLVGRGYLKEKFEEEYAEYSNIIFLPAVAKHQIQAVLNRFDVCANSWHDLPLYQHGVSANKYFDYMLSGKPVLSASNFPMHPIQLANCGIMVKPNSPKAIKEGVLKLYNMTSQERKELGARGKAYVLKYHTYDYLAGLYEEIFTKTKEGVETQAA